MKRQLPPLPWLRAFEASARHLSFTHAADELGLTQAAVSKQVKNLELTLREPLFIRNARSLTMTKLGEAYLPKVRDSFDRLAAGTHEVFGGRRSQVLTIRGASGFNVNWLTPRLPSYMERYPGTQLRIISSVWNEPADARTYDIDIRYGLGHWSDHTSHRLVRDKLFPVCSPKLLQGNTALKKPEQLTENTLLHVLGYQDGWANWLEAAGVNNVDSGGGLFFDTSLQSFQAAIDGLGISIGRTSIAELPLSKGTIVKPFELELPIDEAFYALVPQNNAGHANQARFLEWLLEQAKT